jgi:putative ABC transport system permease protein
VLGVEAGRGRVFAFDEPEGTVVLSDPFFRSAFAGDAGALGRQIELDGRPYTIVGVAPPGFRLALPSFEAPIDLWKTPDNAWDNGDVWRSRQAHQFHVLARLRPDATLQSARHALAAIAGALRASHPEHSRIGWELLAVPLADRVVAESRTTLLVLLGAVACLGLIACANVANLMLVRGRSRHAEVALRAALGASRVRLLRLFLVETSLLAVTGGALAVGATFAGRALLEPWRPAALRGDGDALVDLRVLAFAAGATLVSLLLSGISPALAGSRVDLQADLKDCRGVAARGRRRPSDVLVVLQMALSVLLLSGAGLLLLSLVRLQGADPGFDPRRLYTFSISLPGTRYEWPSDTGAFFEKLEEGLGGAPGIEAVGLVWPAPLSGRSWTGQWTVEGAAHREDLSHYRLASQTFFAAAGVRLVDGRVFQRADERNTVVVSRGLADAAWPGRSALGRRIEAAPWGPPSEWFEVVGVVDDVRYDTLRSVTRPQIYFDSRAWSWADWEVDLVVRSALDLPAVVAAASAVVERLDPAIPVARARPLGAYLEEELAPHRYALGALGLFAVLAACLAVLGLYGVLSTYVLDRRREIVIRVALGSERGAILRLVLRSGLRLVALGLALGWLGALSLGRFLEALLYEVRSREPAILLAVSAALVAAAVLAAWVPARRATRLDPLSVLRG